MPFTNNATQGIDFKLQESEQKAQLKADIAELSAFLETLEARKKEKAVTDEEIAKAKESLATLKGELEGLEKDKAQLEALLATKGDVQADLQRLEDRVAELHADVDALEATKAETESRIASLNEAGDKVIRGIDDERAGKVDEVAELKELLAKLHTEQDYLQETIDGLVAERKDAEAGTEKAKADLGELEQSIVSNQDKLTLAKESFEMLEKSAVNKAEQLNAAYDKKREELETQYQTKAAEYEAREGSISLKEKVLEEKTRLLLKAKGQVEKELGRTINIQI